MTDWYVCAYVYEYVYIYLHENINQFQQLNEEISHKNADLQPFLGQKREAA